MMNCERWSMEGATALVTGGSKGIGRAIVEDLARFGVAVHTCCRNEEELNALLNQWKELNLCVTGSICDVSKPAEREKLMHEVQTIFNGKLDILVHNAGVAGKPWKPVTECNSGEHSLVMATNFDAPFHLSQLAHPLLKASGRGSVVFISPIAGTQSFVEGLAVYASSKGALNQLARSLACEWAGDMIRVNCVAPGFIDTQLTKSTVDNEEFYKRMCSRIPLKTIRKARGGSIFGGVPVLASLFFCNRFGDFGRWRPDNKLILRNQKSPFTPCISMDLICWFRLFLTICISCNAEVYECL